MAAKLKKLKKLELENRRFRQQASAPDLHAPEAEEDEGRQIILEEIRKYEALEKIDNLVIKEEATAKLAGFRAELQASKPASTLHAQANRRLGKAKKAMEDPEVTIAQQQLAMQETQMALADSIAKRGALAAEVRKFQE